MTTYGEEKKTFNLPQFNPQSIQLNDQCLFIGTSGTGKTVAMKSLLHHLTRRQPMRGMVYAPNCPVSWSHPVPERYVHTEFNQATLNHLTTVREKKSSEEKYFCVMDGAFGRDRFYDLLSNNHHFQTTLLISSQTGRDIPAETRHACTSLFLFAGLSDRELELLYGNYFGRAFHNFRMFKTCYKEVTSKPYTALYINRNPSELAVGQWTPNLADADMKINIINDPHLQYAPEQYAPLNTGEEEDAEKKQQQSGNDDADTDPEEDEDDDDDKTTCAPPPSSPVLPIYRPLPPPRPHRIDSFAPPPPAPSCSMFNYISSLFAPIRLCLG